MKAIRSILMMGALMASSAVLSGCSTAGRTTAADMAKMFYAQERTYKSFKMTGFNEMTMKAPDGQLITIESTAPLDSLSVYPRDPGAISQLADGITKIGAVAGATYVGGKLASAPRAILQPAPTIVRPEVFFAPSP
tara:strand:+ start:408 stop:815 length:408 start_codon:yes stop_codon:yes gene_type:complete